MCRICEQLDDLFVPLANKRMRLLFHDSSRNAQGVLLPDIQMRLHKLDEVKMAIVSKVVSHRLKNHVTSC